MNKVDLTKATPIQKVIADTLLDYCPTETYKNALTFVMENGHNAKAFFQNNAEGNEQYNTFVSRYDNKKYTDRLKRERDRARKNKL